MKSVEVRRKRAALLACVALAIGTAGAAGAADPPATETIVLSALTGPRGTDLYVTGPQGTTAFEHVQIQIRHDGANRIVNLKNVGAPGGTATIELEGVGRGAGGRRRRPRPRTEPAADRDPPR